ncbi:MAG: MFS transporter, partial [Anaerovoracaceae bacterium]
MNEKKQFNKYKWLNLLTFSLMYNFVYLGRFNVNNLLPQLREEFLFTGKQEELLTISVFFCYAFGSIINGYLADRYGGKKIILIGTVVSIYANLFITTMSGFGGIFLLWSVNGYFQSMIWVGGISLLSKWWNTGERGRGIGIANFFSGLSHVTAYLLPALLLTLWPYFTWKNLIVFPMYVLGVLLIVFCLLAVESPEKK